MWTMILGGEAENSFCNCHQASKMYNCCFIIVVDFLRLEFLDLVSLESVAIICPDIKYSVILLLCLTFFRIWGGAMKYS